MIVEKLAGGVPVPLTEFLLARIAERKAAAIGAGQIAWLEFRRVDGGVPYTTVAARPLGAHGDGPWIANGQEVTGFAKAVIVFDEAEILAECEAKRRIVEGYQQADQLMQQTPGTDAMAALIVGGAKAFEVVVHELGQLYADHPDYDPAWK